MNDKICGYFLDEQQQEIVLDDSNHLLVVAGAGSGKTLTILGKIHYLINYKGVLPKEILCISFTKASASSLKEKIKKEFLLDMPVYTFHKLSLEILKEDSISYEITSSDTLDNVIHEFFSIRVLESCIYRKKVFQYFSIKGIGDTRDKYLKFYKRYYDKLEMLEKQLSTFLHLFKCNNFSLQDFSNFLEISRKKLFNWNYKKEKIFLSFALNIYLIYQEYLKENNEIDFDDMIIYATKYARECGVRNPYKYIIIDEYQDTSYIRFLLIKSILDYTKAKLMVVGDDFQSIYKFTGCDLSLFLDFQKYFEDAKVMKIENTYRNSMELVKIAGDFVMRNRSQIKKDLKSKKHIDYPIQIVYYKEIEKAFFNLVMDIYRKTQKPILVLGRNNKDIEVVLGNNFKIKENGRLICKTNEKLEVYYLTAHKSKGLEEENVVVINLEDKLLGFPSQIKEDKMLRFVNRSFDKYPYSEERRLFYVALTRTKNYVYLLTPRRGYSIFIRELLKDYKRKIKILNY